MSKGKIVLGALFGAIAGFATGILTAPKSGKETRADIANKTSEVAGEVSKKAEEVAKDVTKKAEYVAGEASDIYGNVKDKASEVAGSIKTEAGDLKNRTGRAVEGAKKGFFNEK